MCIGCVVLPGIDNQMFTSKQLLTGQAHDETTMSSLRVTVRCSAEATLITPS
ncbi:hypothetical protein J6590_039603 [Homalodisca vitripennis]|nr:hypothetical protein J6590_039603 [Homalodisca vitripennis]